MREYVVTINGVLKGKVRARFVGTTQSGARTLARNSVNRGMNREGKKKVTSFKFQKWVKEMEGQYRCDAEISNLTDNRKNKITIRIAEVKGAKSRG